MIRSLRWTGVIVALGLCPARAEEPERLMLELKLRGAQVEGAPLAWSDDQVDLLSRDGRLWSFAPDEPIEFRRSASSFRGYTAAEMKGRMAREMGNSFEISGTGHYLVVHPVGKGDYWSPRFEELYRSFVHYFSVRGFDLSEPEFPLVAVIFETKDDFLRNAQREEVKIAGEVLGYYSPETNRVNMYDMGGGAASGDAWHEHAATIIHEATHQTAFNTGVHRRFAEPPLWLIEGLATMFEAPGVWNSRRYTQVAHRINEGRLADFRKNLPGRKPGTLPELVGSDRMFRENMLAAYAEAWAISFFLIETMPRQYAEYLARTAERPAFEKYTSSDRMADFTASFGSDLRMLEARFLRFIAAL